MRYTASVLSVAGLVLGAVVVALLPSAALFESTAPHDPAAESAAGERWACPMMDFIGRRPGDCPVCGMEMARVTAGELTREQQRRMEVSLTTVARGPARVTMRAYGTVRYDDRTEQVVIPRVAGRIVKRHDAARHAGVLVAEGDPVVDLYSPDLFALQGELAAALALGDEAAVAALRDRLGRLHLGGVADAIIAGNEPVDTVTITSPFGGRVVTGLDGAGDGTELPQVGREVAADAPLLRLVDPAAYIVVVQVPEARAHAVRVGQPARLASDDRGTLPELGAVVSWVAPELEPMLRTREVHLHLRDPAGRLLAGGLVEARLESVLDSTLQPADPGRTEAWGSFVLVPKTAVLSTGVRHVAWRVAERHPDGRLRFELAPLALGPRIEDEHGNDVWVVRAGLEAGDEVATQGVFLIDSQAQLAGTPSLLFPHGAVAPTSGPQTTTEHVH